MDASTDATAGNDPGQQTPVGVGGATPSHPGTVGSVQTYNGSHTVNPPGSGGELGSFGQSAAIMPPAATSVIQQPLMYSQGDVSSAGAPVTPGWPPMQNAWSGATLNGNINAGAAGQPGGYNVQYPTPGSFSGWPPTTPMHTAPQPAVTYAPVGWPDAVPAGPGPGWIPQQAPQMYAPMHPPPPPPQPAVTHAPWPDAVPAGPVWFTQVAPQMDQNIQVPPGMVIVRNDRGRLVMVPQHIVDEMEAASGHMRPRPVLQSNVPFGQDPATIIQQGYPATNIQQGYPATIIQQGYPATNIQQGYPATNIQQGYPATNIQQGYPATIIQQGYPATNIQQGYPATNIQQGYPATNIQQGYPATNIQQGYPATNIQQGYPATNIQQGYPASTTFAANPPILQSSVPGMTPMTYSQTAETIVPSVTVSEETMEDASKCKNFLFTLIKLATNMKKSTLVVVKALTKDLLEGKLEAEEFTNKLYKELETSPQSYLVPFLTKSVPALRQYVPNSTTFIMHCEYPELVSGPVFSTSLPPTMMQPSIGQQGQTASMVLPLQQQSGTVTPQVNFPTTPMVMLGNQAPGHIMLGQQQFQHKTLHPTAFTPAFKKNLRDTGGYVKDYDELNDVAFMAGVNLEEESANILASNSGLMGAVTHSCEDEPFLSCSLLQERMLEIGSRYGITNLDAEVVNLVSHATQQRLQNLLESVSLVARQRNVNLKEDDELEQSDGARAQLRFLHQLEKQRKEAAEREILLKAAKARTRREDPEQLRLKQKAKEMQQQELAQMRQRQSNMTALAAIGPRKKKSILDSESSSAAAEGSGAGSSLPGVGGPTRQRITRVHRTDLLHCMENDKSLRHSRLLYKWFLK